LDKPKRQPITIDRIVASALEIVEVDGFDALTMRGVAAALHASPGALYVHVQDKAALDDLLLGELCSRVVLPEPHPAVWQAQVFDVCRQLRDQYLLFPGVARTVFAAAPLSLDTLRVAEGLLAILIAAGADVRAAAWATDSALVYIAAYSAISPRRSADSGSFDRAELIERYRMLPPNRFPITANHAEEITSGDNHERFDATLGRLFSGVVPDQEGHHER
jgi:AcrR family transcriptional regulator